MGGRGGGGGGGGGGEGPSVPAGSQGVLEGPRVSQMSRGVSGSVSKKKEDAGDTYPVENVSCFFVLARLY